MRDVFLIGQLTQEALVAAAILVLIYSPLIVIYLLPSIIAFNRGRKNSGAIFVLNLLLGWSVIGWVVALVWSIKEPTTFVPPDNVYSLQRRNEWADNLWLAWDESQTLFWIGLFWGGVSAGTSYLFGSTGWPGVVVTVSGSIAVYAIFIVIPFAFIKISLFGKGGIPCKACGQSLKVRYPTNMKKCGACGAVHEIRWETT